MDGPGDDAAFRELKDENPGAGVKDVALDPAGHRRVQVRRAVGVNGDARGGAHTAGRAHGHRDPALAGRRGEGARQHAGAARAVRGDGAAVYCDGDIAGARPGFDAVRLRAPRGDFSTRHADGHVPVAAAEGQDAVGFLALRSHRTACHGDGRRPAAGLLRMGAVGAVPCRRDGAPADGQGDVARASPMLGEDGVGPVARRRRVAGDRHRDVAAMVVPAPDGEGALRPGGDGAAGDGNGDVALARPGDRDRGVVFRGRRLPDPGQDAVGFVARRRDDGSRRVDGDVAGAQVTAVDADGAPARGPDFAVLQVDVDGAAARRDRGGAVRGGRRDRPALVVRKNAVGGNAPGQDMTVRHGDPDVAQAFVIGVDAPGLVARQRREEHAAFVPGIGNLRPRGRDASRGDGVALHGDGDVTVGRGAGVFGPDGVGLVAPRRDERPRPGRAVALGLDDIDDHRAPGAVGPPVLEEVGTLLEGVDAVGEVAARRRQRHVAEVDPDPAAAAPVFGRDAVGFLARVEISVAHRPDGVSAVVQGVEVQGLARRVDAAHVDHQVAVAPGVVALPPGGNAGHPVLGDRDPGIFDDDVAVPVDIDEPAIDRLGGDQGGLREGAEEGPQVILGESAEVRSRGENRRRRRGSGGALEDRLRAGVSRAEGERGPASNGGRHDEVRLETHGVPPSGWRQSGKTGLPATGGGGGATVFSCPQPRGTYFPAGYDAAPLRGNGGSRPFDLL